MQKSEKLKNAEKKASKKNPKLETLTESAQLKVTSKIMKKRLKDKKVKK